MTTFLFGVYSFVAGAAFAAKMDDDLRNSRKPTLIRTMASVLCWPVLLPLLIWKERDHDD